MLFIGVSRCCWYCTDLDHSYSTIKTETRYIPIFKNILPARKTTEVREEAYDLNTEWPRSKAERRPRS